MSEMPIHLQVAAGALIIGLALGALVQRSRFCTMAAVAEAVVVRRYDHLRAWLFAIVVAVVGTQILSLTGLVDTASSIYLSPNLFWLGPIVGGLLFGVGMVKASGCGLRNLVNAGGGDLRALIAVATMAIFAYVTLRGLFAPAQLTMREVGTIALAEGMPTQGLVDLTAHYTGLSVHIVRFALLALILAPIIAFCLRGRRFLAQPRYWATGLGIGLLVIAGWFVTGYIGNDDFEPSPVASLSIVAPTADTAIYFMTYTGATINFGISLVFGIVLGAMLMALIRGEFSLVGFNGDKQDTTRYLIGGALMGTGGVLAGGCTLGQGITGVATLSISSLLALAFTVLGGVLAVQRRERSKQRDTDIDSINSTNSPNAMALTAAAGEFNACGN